jgi:hypothetical protein
LPISRSIEKFKNAVRNLPPEDARLFLAIAQFARLGTSMTRMLSEMKFDNSEPLVRQVRKCGTTSLIEGKHIPYPHLAMINLEMEQ